MSKGSDGSPARPARGSGRTAVVRLSPGEQDHIGSARLTREGENRRDTQELT
ncbi:hypothetical protein ACQP1K_04525 [Sphaerimonospora sp. CA-214678]|uniref:hypothetical protein n=1 Tax=Sphaerimonospora sp. CA-214678 TaxID=3240029 RepID=UPI003D92ECE8